MGDSLSADWRLSFLWQLTEEQFWKRYFQSKLFNAHRASIRSSAAQHVVKDDEIFDKYLERDDDGEPIEFSYFTVITHLN